MGAHLNRLLRLDEDLVELGAGRDLVLRRGRHPAEPHAALHREDVVEDQALSYKCTEL